MVLGLVFSGVFWFLWVGVFLGDGRSIVGGREWSLMELMGSGLNRTIPVGGEFSCFLGALGGDGGLVGDGDGDLTGESEKGFLTKEDLADDFCLDWDLDGGGRLDWVSCCVIGVAGGLEDLEDDGLEGDLPLSFWGIVGGMVSSLMELLGSGLDCTISEGRKFPWFLGALGGDGDLVGDGDLAGDGDLTGESEKDSLTKKDLADDLCLDFDPDGGGRLD